MESGLITSLKVSPGGAYDGRYLRPLIEADRRKGIPVQTVAGDRAYMMMGRITPILRLRACTQRYGLTLTERRRKTPIRGSG
ncbi:MAG: hypothetical protein A2Y60_06835 [Chloroflexi bacterium RBG_13_54_9]|nr:MAG: hypothetical protein A2Y60_06835 [Chloroflexi bacterium RBG_13_54_9]